MSSAFGDIQDQQEAQSVDLSDNVVGDIVQFLRGNIVGHEEEGVLMYLGILSGWGHADSHHINTIGQGPPGSGKSLTKNTVEELLDNQDTYTKTDVSSNAILDSREWDLALSAPLDEIDKIDKDIIEILKSSNSEDGGYEKDRNVEDSDARGGYSPVEVGADAIPWIVLYAPSSKKGGINDELADRALKLYFNNDKHTRRGIGRKEFGHDSIEISSDEYEYNYIYDTHELGAALRQHVRELPVQSIYEEDEDGEQYLASRTGDTIVHVPEWVWYAAEPIFSLDEDYTNRVYGIVVNLIKSSALLNHENRNTKEVEVYIDADSTEQEVREAVVVAPQDVANVLSCMPSLLSTTHQLTPLKRHLLDAIGETEPMTDSDGTTVTKVQEWLDDNDIPHPSRSTLKKRMDDLAEDYYLTKYDSLAGPKGNADAYELNSEGALQTPRINSLQTHADRDDIQLGTDPAVDVDPSAPFAECDDPIRQQSFEETVSEFDEQFSPSSDSGITIEEAMGGDSSNTDSKGGSSGSDPKGQQGEDGGSQASLSDTTSDGVETNDNTIESDVEPQSPTEQHVLELLQEMRGEVLPKKFPVVQKVGLVDDQTDPSQADLSKTIANPDDELWQDRPDFSNDRVITQEDALSEIEQAYNSLKVNGLVVEDTDSAPPAMCRLQVAEL